MTILVTGGAGFIGSNFVRHWRVERPDEDIVILDALTYAGVRENVEGLDGVELIVGDICDTAMVEKLLRDRAITRLIHFAAESHVDRSISGPGAFIQTNIVGTQSLLDAAKAVWLDDGSGQPHRFHHVSTDEVYGTLGSNDAAFTEETPFAPNSPYAASKAASDHLVRAWHRTYGLDVVTTNCSNNYGPYQFPEKLIPLCIQNALNGKPLPIYGDGQQVRDWLYVEDHCRGIIAGLEKGQSGDTYNIGGGAEMTNIDLVQMLCAEIDTTVRDSEAFRRSYPKCPVNNGKDCSSLIAYVMDRPGHDQRYAINDDKARDAIGYVPEVTFVNGMRRTVAWYLTDRT